MRSVLASAVLGMAFLANDAKAANLIDDCLMFATAITFAQEKRQEGITLKDLLTEALAARQRLVREGGDPAKMMRNQGIFALGSTFAFMSPYAKPAAEIADWGQRECLLGRIQL